MECDAIAGALRRRRTPPARARGTALQISIARSDLRAQARHGRDHRARDDGAAAESFRHGYHTKCQSAACGTARWTLDYALEQARRPHRTGAPLGEREQVQAMLGESAMDLFAARGALYAAARAAEAGAAETEVAMAKAIATEAVARIVDRAIQLSGGAAVVEGHPEREPDQADVGGNLNDPLLTARQPQQQRAYFLHASLEHEFNLLSIDRCNGR